MGDILGEWLNSTILREISDGLQWLESRAINSVTKDSHFEDDGETLKAKISKPGNVQVLKFVTFEGPIEAWVSDSITRLQVRFAASAAHKYREETRKRVTQDSVGGILQITDFEILATHLGPRPSRLTILIKDFQNVGSNGSGGFGVPRALNDLPETVNLLDRLQMLRSQECSKARQNLITREVAENCDLQLGTQSDTNCSSPVNRSRPASQETFATQVPRSRLVKSSDLHARNPKNISGHRKSNDSPNLDRIMKSPLDSATETLEVLSSTTTAEVTTNTNAANLSIHLQTSGSSLRKIPGTVKNRPTHQDLLHLLPTNGVPKINKRPKIDTTPVSPGGNPTSSASQIVSLELDDQGGKAQSIPARNAATSEEPVPSEVSKAVVARSIEKLNGEAKVLNNAKSVPELEAVPLPSSVRIRFREVKISKHQQALLENSNSWIPAKPGGRKPIGNIPVAILKIISDQVDGSSRYSPRQNVQPSSRAKSLASSSSSDSDSEASQDSDEIPISSGQWPASPPREQIYGELPSDSSEEATFQADQAEKIGEERISAHTPQKLPNSLTYSPSANVDSGNLDVILKPSRKAIGSSTPSSSPSRQNFRMSGASEPERKIITGERTSPAKYGNDKFDTSSAMSSALAPIDVILEKSMPTMVTVSQETEYLDQHVIGAERNHLEPNTVSDHSESIDHNSQEKMVNEALKRSGQPSNTINPIDANVEIDSSENIGNIDSSAIEIASMQLSGHSENTLERDDASAPTYQSTAPESDEPVLQVEATPYVNGHILKSTSIDRSECLSPSRKDNGLPRNRTHYDKSDERPLSQTIIEISSAQIPSSKSMEDVLADFSSSEMALKSSVSAKIGPADLRVQQVADNQNSRIAYDTRNDITHIEETFISATAPPETSSEDYVAVNPPIKAKDDLHTMKRKFPELQSPSLETAKRQKQVERLTSKSTEDSKAMVDPSILGDKYRQDFYNSRKGLISSHTNEAPQTPTGSHSSSTPGSHAKSMSREGLSGGKTKLDAPLHYTSREKTSVPDPEHDDMDETISPSEDVEEPGKVIFGPRRLAAKPVEPSNAALKMSENQINSNIQAQDAGQNVSIKGAGSLTKLPIFDQFKAVYPDYTATSQQFIAICRKIERLVKDGHMLHQFLWDDFIIRHKTEYPAYLVSCAEKAEDPLPYEQFYHENIVKPHFTDGIVKPDNIHQAFLPTQQLVHTDDQRSKQQRNARIATSPKLTADITTIDLTSDEKVTRSAAEKKSLMDPSTRKSPRSLPWVTTTTTDNRSRVEEITPTKKKTFSRTSSSTHISHSPFRSAAPSNSRTLKTSHGGGGGGSSSPKKMVAFWNDPASNEVFARAAETTISHKSGIEQDSNTLRNESTASSVRRQFKSTHGAKSADDTEPQTRHAESTTLNHDFRPPQPKNGQKSHSHSSTTPHNTHLSPHPSPKPNPKPKLALSPQESSSTSREQPHSATGSHTEAAPPQGTTASGSSSSKNDKDKDKNNENKDNNPLASFVKAYTAIRPGQGNSYARDRNREKGVVGKDSGAGSGNDGEEEIGAGEEGGDGEEIKQKQKRKIDVMSWRLRGF